MTPVDLKIKRSVVSTINFSNRVSLDHIKHELRKIRATGQLTIHVSQGGINAVVFEARNSLNGNDHVELLFDTPTLP